MIIIDSYEKIHSFKQDDYLVKEGTKIHLKHEQFSPQKFSVNSEEELSNLSKFHLSSVFLCKKNEQKNMISIFQPANGVFLESKFFIENIYKVKNSFFAICQGLLFNLSDGVQKQEIRIIDKISPADLIQMKKDAQLLKELYEIIELQNLGLLHEKYITPSIRHYILHNQSKWKIGNLSMFDKPMI